MLMCQAWLMLSNIVDKTSYVNSIGAQFAPRIGCHKPLSKSSFGQISNIYLTIYAPKIASLPRLLILL